MPSLKSSLVIMAIVLLGVPVAWADCTNPTGKESEAVYNGDYHTWQFCNGTGWTAMGSVYTVPWVTNGTDLYYNGGNVGIGTSSPASALHIKNTAATLTLQDSGHTATGNLMSWLQTFDSTGAQTAYIGYGGTNNFDIWTTGSQPIRLATSGSERMRIDASGNVGIGTTSPGGLLDVEIGGTGHKVIFFEGGNSALFQDFYYSNASVGRIYTNGSSTIYQTTSDRRLKENIKPTTSGLANVMRIPVKDFNFIRDPSKTVVQGFIAQDLYRIYPEAVTVGGKDPVKNPWMVDYGRMTPLLVKAVQELKADNDNLRQEFETYKQSHP